MLVNVKTKKLVNTPLSATLAHCSVSSVLNRDETLSGSGEKTCLNFSKGSWIQSPTPTGKLFGLRKFDKIETDSFVGFVKGKRSTGYFSISDIEGKIIHSSYNIKKRKEQIGFVPENIYYQVTIPPLPKRRGFLVRL